MSTAHEHAGFKHGVGPIQREVRVTTNPLDYVGWTSSCGVGAPTRERVSEAHLSYEQEARPYTETEGAGHTCWHTDGVLLCGAKSLRKCGLPVSYAQRYVPISEANLVYTKYTTKPL